MNLTNHERLELISKIETELSYLGDYVYPDGDINVNATINILELTLKKLKESFYDENTYVKLVDNETNEVTMKYFEQGDINALCLYAARFYAFSDCDDTYRIEEIAFSGNKLIYTGWQPNMTYEFIDARTGEVVWSNSFPNWDH